MTTLKQIAGQAQTTPHNLSVALALADDGIPVFPCRDGSEALPNGKPDRRPYVRWRAEATTDKATIEAWWKQWPDAVPGVPTGEASGLAVLDLDRKNGKDGIAAMEALGFAVPEGSCIVDTPSGGRHVYFEHVDGVRNADSHLPDGVDVRGEGGFVFAPGAVDSRGVYRARADFRICRVLGFPAFPDALRAPVGPVDAPVAPAGELDPATLLAALGAIPCNGSHDDWNRVLMALHHETGGSAEGLAVAQLWSSGDPRYSPGEVAGKWRSYGHKDGPQVAAGTLMILARAHGWRGRDLADAFADLPDEDDDGEAAMPALSPFMPSCEAGLGTRPPYLVKGLVAQGQSGAILGAPGVGKSFLGPEMAHCIAVGRPFCDRRVKPARTLYLSAEDPHGLELRVRALCEAHGPAPDLVLGRMIPNLRIKEEVEALRLALRRDKVRVVFIDTLAAAMPGLEENDAGAGGMGAVVALVQQLRRDGLTVVLIHHTAKASDGSARGHSSLQGILDFTIPLGRTGDVVSSTTPAKNRCGVADHAIAFTIRGVDLDLPPDEDGDPIRSAICVPCPAVARAVKPLKPASKATLALVLTMMDGASEIDEATFRAAARDDARISGSDVADNRRRVVSNALTDLARARRIEIKDGTIRCLPIAQLPAGDLRDAFQDLEDED